MTTRDALIRDFLASMPWGAADIKPLAGDASNRRYLRLHMPGTDQTAVLMDAPPETGEDIRPFMKIAVYLSGQGLSAPQILAADEANGLLLLEDLGDALFARVLKDAPQQEALLYTHATDLLAQLHAQTPPDDLAPYTPDLMADMAALACDWYAPAAADVKMMADDARITLRATVLDVLKQYAPNCDVLIQRDYHAENLLWLPERNGAARVGLLDFQDAMLGHRAYDLVSLLQDARRDVSLSTEADMLTQYIAQTDVDADAFRAAYHCLGAQRNLRIVGVFTRLCVRDGKAPYVDLIPRVWGLLQRDLAQPYLQDVADAVRMALPEPTPETLDRIKAQCATIPPQ